MNYRSLFKAFIKKNTALYIIAIFMIVLVYFFNYKVPIIQKDIVDEIFENHSGYSIYKYLAYSVLIIVLSVINVFITVNIHRRASKNYFMLFFKNLEKQPQSDLKAKGASYYYNIIVNDSENIISFINFFDIVSLSVGIIQVGFILNQFRNWNTTLFIIILSQIVLVILYKYLTPKIPAFYQKELIETRDCVQSSLNDIIQNRSLIRNNCSSEIALCELESALNRNGGLQLKQSIINQFIYKSYDLVMMLGNMFLLFTGINELVSGTISKGDFLAVLTYYAMIFIPLNHWGDFSYKLSMVKAAKERISSLFTSKKSSEVCIIKNIENVSVSDIDDEGADIIFKNNIVNGIVGMSGEGKTSLIKCFNKDSGASVRKLYLNSIVPENILQANYFSLINILSQDNEIFDSDLIYNLTLGKKVVSDGEKNVIIADIISELDYLYNNKISYERLSKEGNFKILELFLGLSCNFENSSIEKVLKQIYSDYYDLKDYIVNTLFNMNYVVDTDLINIINKLSLKKLKDRDFGENGSKISGGEKQKIMLGRFLLKRDYQFFVIDEPFTNLDSVTELELLNVLKEELRGKTGIIISHKMNVISSLCKNIYVVDNNRMVGAGSHKELYNSNLIYKNLFDSYYNKGK